MRKRGLCGEREKREREGMEMRGEKREKKGEYYACAEEKKNAPLFFAVTGP
jgi:hypothetical protein